MSRPRSVRTMDRISAHSKLSSRWTLETVPSSPFQQRGRRIEDIVRWTPAPASTPAHPPSSRQTESDFKCELRSNAFNYVNLKCSHLCINPFFVSLNHLSTSFPPPPLFHSLPPLALICCSCIVRHLLASHSFVAVVASIQFGHRLSLLVQVSLPSQGSQQTRSIDCERHRSHRPRCVATRVLVSWQASPVWHQRQYCLVRESFHHYLFSPPTPTDPWK